MLGEAFRPSDNRATSTATPLLPDSLRGPTISVNGPLSTSWAIGSGEWQEQQK
jgi:hypothetical protein